MIDCEFSSNQNENYKHIEDIIDARKRLGQYNVNKQSHTVNYRYAYSASGVTDRFIRFDDMMVSSEGDNLSANYNLKRTDSEITIVRIGCDNSNIKRRSSKWNMHDIAVPGDGSHLAESPSLVNLATLVGQNVHCEGDEYLVPLSSWDPYYKLDDCSGSESNKSTPIRKIDDEENSNTISNINNNNNELSNDNKSIKSENAIIKQKSWAGRLSKFIRKHCMKTKTLPMPNSNNQI